MSISDWMFGAKPKGRTIGLINRTPTTNQNTANRVVVDPHASGEAPAAGRFPKLTDGRPEVLTSAPTSAAVGKAGTFPSAITMDSKADPASAALPVQASPPATVADVSAQRRQSRSRTRVLGFEPEVASVVALFGGGQIEDVGQPGGKANVVNRPTGWLVVTQGPGRGAAFALSHGVSQIGRGPDHAVALDFGDMTISRQKDVAIAYDPQTHQFHVGHGGKANHVRLNGKPLLSTERISDGDEIQIGETVLMLKVLCTPAFNWSQSDAGGDAQDIAIA